MGKGDRKTRRGKIFRKSYGNYRLAKSHKAKVVVEEKPEVIEPEVQPKEVVETIVEAAPKVKKVAPKKTAEPKKETVKKESVKKEAAKKETPKKAAVPKKKEAKPKE